jgi:hypothetical protein
MVVTLSAGNCMAALEAFASTNGTRQTSSVVRHCPLAMICVDCWTMDVHSAKLKILRIRIFVQTVAHC